MATERINLAEFNVDIDSLIKDTENLKFNIDAIVFSQKELVKQGKASSAEFVKNAAELRGLRQEYTANIKVISEVGAATGQFISLENELNAVLGRETKSVNDLRKQVSDLTKIRNNLNLTTDEGKNALLLINAQLDENNAKIKENVSANEQARMNVGNYAESIKQAFGDLNIFGQSQKEVNATVSAASGFFTAAGIDMRTAFSIITSGSSATAKLSSAFKILRVALISTGIGAIVVALGSLVAYLTSTAEGVDRLNRFLIPLKTVGSAIIGIMQDLGKALFDAFSNPKQVIKDVYNFIKDNFIGQMQSLGRVLKGVFTLDWDLMKQGFNDLDELAKKNARAITGYFSSVGDTIKEAWGVGQEIADLTERINASEIEMAKNQARINREINENREIARDISKAQSERNAAAEKSIALAKELRDLEVDHQKLIVERLKLEQSQSASTQADMLEMAKEEAKLDEIEAGHAQLMIRLNSNLNSARTAGNKDAKKAQEDAINKQQESLELFIAEQGIRAKSLQEELELEQQISERKRQILKAELDAKKITQEKYNADILNLNNELLKRQAEIAVDNVKRELDSVEDRVAIEKALSEAKGLAAIEEEEKRFNELQEARARFELVRFQEGVTSEVEYQDAVAEIRTQIAIREAEFAKERKAQIDKDRVEQLSLDLDSQFLALEALHANEMDIRALKIEQDREMQLEQARQRYTDESMLAQAILNIDQNAANLQAKLEEEKNIAVWESRANLAGALSKLVGEETLLGKSAAIAQATINTYLGVTKALATLPPPASWIAAATTLSTGLSTVGQITGITSSKTGANIPSRPETATKEQAMVAINAIPPFAKGGLVTGGIPINRSNGDNVLATLRTGEVVLNENQQDMLGGAVVFKSIGVPGFATGGLVGGSNATIQNSIFAGIDSALADTIGDAVQKGARIGTESGSRSGIMDLSTERYIERNLSSF